MNKWNDYESELLITSNEVRLRIDIGQRPSLPILIISIAIFMRIIVKDVIEQFEFSLPVWWYASVQLIIGGLLIREEIQLEFFLLLWFPKQ